TRLAPSRSPNGEEMSTSTGSRRSARSATAGASSVSGVVTAARDPNGRRGPGSCPPASPAGTGGSGQDLLEATVDRAGDEFTELAFAEALDGRGEETLDDQPLGFLVGQAAATEVEQ